ncbi:MAG: sulfotransferase [Bacteroidota bacterium]
MKNIEILIILIKAFGVRKLHLLILFIKSLHGCLNSIFLFFDYIFYPRFRKTKLSKPVFLIGHPRSGTTFMHRFIIENSDEFRSLNLYDMLFPSLTSKKVSKRWIPKMEKIAFDKLYDPVIHKTGLYKAETEDVALFLRYFDGLLSWNYFFLHKNYKTEKDFEKKAIRKLSRNKYIIYLRNVYKRNLYKSDQRMLSKSFALIFCFNKIVEDYPDGKIILMLRDPVYAIPSFISLVSGVQNKMNKLDKQSEEIRNRFYSNFYKTSLLYYKKFHEIVSRNDTNPNLLMITHKELMSDFDTAINKIILFYDMKVTEKLSAAISDQIKKQTVFKSKHEYSLNDFGLSEEQVREDFAFIYKNYDV